MEGKGGGISTRMPNMRLEFESQRSIFLRTPGDVSSCFYADKNRSFFVCLFVFGAMETFPSGFVTSIFGVSQKELLTFPHRLMATKTGILNQTLMFS